MGKDSKSKELSSVAQTAGNQYNQLYSGQTGLEKEFIPQSQGFYNAYQNALNQQTGDYSNIMQGYKDFSGSMGSPTKFSYQSVGAARPAELDESYGYLREAVPGYRDFAETGGYSPTDIQELRARGVSPIRTAYSNTMMEMNRARALGGAGGSPNYIAAASAAQREMPGQMADALTGVNAKLAEDIRTGKLAGLGGLSNTGATMGNLSSEEAGRMLQASMANQSADLQAQNLSEQSLQNMRQAELAGLSGQTSLYGTTPAMAATFGNQALNAYQTRAQMEQSRNQYGLGLLDAQIKAYGGQSSQDPWWKQLLSGLGSVAPYASQLLGNGQGQQGQPLTQNQAYSSQGSQQFYNQNPYSYPYAGDTSYWSQVGGPEYSNPNNNMGFTGWDTSNPSLGDPSWYSSGYDNTGWYANSPYA